MYKSMAAFASMAGFVAFSAAAHPPTIAQLSADPRPWAGREVRLEGLVVYEFEHFAIYASHADYCANRNGFGVDWDDAHLTRLDTRRFAVVRGRVTDPEREVVPVDNAAGIWRLEDVRVLGWLSDPLPPCRLRQ